MGVQVAAFAAARRAESVVACVREVMPVPVTAMAAMVVEAVPVAAWGAR